MLHRKALVTVPFFYPDIHMNKFMMWSDLKPTEYTMNSICIFIGFFSYLTFCLTICFEIMPSIQPNIKIYSISRMSVSLLELICFDLPDINHCMAIE